MSTTKRMRVLFFGAAIFSAMASQALAGRLTCEPGSEALCEEYCTHTNGGMSSNPDGSVTCTFSIKPTEKVKTNVKRVNDNDWLVVRHPDKPQPTDKQGSRTKK
jgi:hypothetical protein